MKKSNKKRIIELPKHNKTMTSSSSNPYLIKTGVVIFPSCEKSTVLLNNRKIEVSKDRMLVENHSIPKEIQINTTVYRNPAYVTGGGFGGIYVYTSKLGKQIILKKAFDNKGIDNDLTIHRLLNNQCNVLQLVQVEDRSYVMEKYDGDLSDLCGSMKNLLTTAKKIKIIEQIMYKVSLLLECFRMNNIYYTDLKPDNVLYKCVNKKDFQITMGDLGGGVDTTNANHIVIRTYVPYHRKFLTVTEWDVVWTIGFMGLVLYERLMGKKKSEYDLTDTKNTHRLYKHYSSCELAQCKKCYRDVKCIADFKQKLMTDILADLPNGKLRNLLYSVLVQENIKTIREIIKLMKP